MAKKSLIMASIMGAILLLGIFSFSLVSAQPSNKDPDNDHPKTPPAIGVQLTHLENRLTKTITAEQNVISVIQTNVPSADVSALQTTVTDTQMLLTTVQGADPTTTTQGVVNGYRSQANNPGKQFRQEVKTLFNSLTGSQKMQLMKLLHPMHNT